MIGNTWMIQQKQNGRILAVSTVHFIYTHIVYSGQFHDVCVSISEIEHACSSHSWTCSWVYFGPWFNFFNHLTHVSIDKDALHHKVRKLDYNFICDDRKQGLDSPKILSLANESKECIMKRLECLPIATLRFTSPNSSFRDTLRRRSHKDDQVVGIWAKMPTNFSVHLWRIGWDGYTLRPPELIIREATKDIGIFLNVIFFKESN